MSNVPADVLAIHKKTWPLDVAFEKTVATFQERLDTVNAAGGVVAPRGRARSSAQCTTGNMPTIGAHGRNAPRQALLRYVAV